MSHIDKFITTPNFHPKNVQFQSTEPLNQKSRSQNPTKKVPIDPRRPAMIQPRSKSKKRNLSRNLLEKKKGTKGQPR